MTRWMFLIGTTALGGCASLNDLRTDLSAPRPQVGNEQAALVQNLRAAYVPCGAPRTPTGAQAAAAENVSCVRFKTSGDAAEISNFTNAGLTLSDLACDDFFRRTNQSARKRRFGRGVANDTSVVVAAALKLAAAGSNALVASATAFNFVDKGFRNYDESFMVSAELARVRRLVLSAQDKLKTEILATPPKTFFAAESKITRYAGLCSFLGMQDLLGVAVDNAVAKVEAETKPGATATPPATTDTPGSTGTPGSPSSTPAASPTTVPKPNAQDPAPLTPGQGPQSIVPRAPPG